MVGPLRGLRTQLKRDGFGAPVGPSKDLRERIKSCELEAERIEQSMLFQALGDAPSAGGQDHAKANMEAYFEVVPT